MTKPTVTVEELREALSEHGRDNYEHGYWERASDSFQAAAHRKDAHDAELLLQAAIDELATRRERERVLVEALAGLDAVLDFTHPFEECGTPGDRCPNCPADVSGINAAMTKARAALATQESPNPKERP